MTNSCYKITEWYKQIVEEGANGNFDTFAKRKLDLPSHTEAKLQLNSMFEDAIEEISHIPNLNDQAISKLIRDVRNFHGCALLAASEISTKTFIAKAKIIEAIHTLDLTGHILKGTNTVRGIPLDRAAFTATAHSLMQEVKESDLSEPVKAVLLLKFNAILRIMSECSGISDDQIRRRLKSIYADISAEFEKTRLEDAGVIVKTKEWIKSTMKPGVFALGITADILAVAAIAGPDAMIALQAPTEVRLIEGPSTKTNDASGETTSQE